MEEQSSQDTFSSPSEKNALPRIICFHGSGSSAKIFQIQTIRLQRLLKDHFRFVFVNGPFATDAGPGVAAFFGELGPFWRWSRRDPQETGEQVTAAVERAIAGQGQGVLYGIGDKTNTDMGPVVGLLGFSQGASLGAGLLEQQQRQNKAGEQGYGLRFGVFCMSGYPILLPSKGPPAESEVARSEFDGRLEGEIAIPSVHLHGLEDPYLNLGRNHYRCFDPNTTRLLEMDLEHRLPITPEDNETLANAIIELYKRTAPSGSTEAPSASG